MQVVVPLHIAKVTGVVGIFQICTILVRKSLLVKYFMCCLNKTITTLNHSVIIAGFVKFTF